MESVNFRKAVYYGFFTGLILSTLCFALAVVPLEFAFILLNKIVFISFPAQILAYKVIFGLFFAVFFFLGFLIEANDEIHESQRG